MQNLGWYQEMIIKHKNISTLYFQDSGQIQNGAHDWQTFLMIPKHMGNELGNQLFN